jgi:CBS domain-containing protein
MTAGDLCARTPIAVPAETTVSDAALRMVAERVHRVFAERDGEIVGVFSTKDVLAAIVAARIPTRIRDVMSHPLYTIEASATLAHATDRLASAHVTGLTVIDDVGWPIGYFAQREALLARDRPGDTLVEEGMSCALVCLHGGAELHRAAALARAAHARRVLVIEDRRAVGVLTPLDFARTVSAAARAAA